MSKRSDLLHYSVCQIVSNVESEYIKTNGILIKQDDNMFVLATIDTLYNALQIMVYVSENKNNDYIREIAARVKYKNHDLGLVILELDTVDTNKWDHDVFNTEHISSYYLPDNFPIKVHSVDYHNQRGKLSNIKLVIDTKITNFYYDQYDNFSPKLPHYTFAHDTYEDIIGACIIDGKNNIVGIVNAFSKTDKKYIYNMIPSITILNFINYVKSSVYVISDKILNKIHPGDKINDVVINTESLIFSTEMNRHIEITTYIAFHKSSELKICVDNIEQIVQLKQLATIRRVPRAHHVRKSVINFHGLVFSYTSCDIIMNMVDGYNVCGKIVDIVLKNNICKNNKRAYIPIILDNIINCDETKHIMRRFVTEPIFGIQYGSQIEILSLIKINGKRIKNITSLRNRQKIINKLDACTIILSNLCLTFKNNVWRLLD